jgi:hypothetical protein
VAADELGEFHSAVVILARHAGNGRLSANSVLLLDAFGRPAGSDRLRAISAGTVVLVHLLSGTEAERHDLIADLLPQPLALAA